MSDQDEQQRTTTRQLAFVLDIDGCLSCEGVPIPGAAAGLKRLRDHNIPFTFCTNGGGQLEETRARKLSKTFGIDVDPESVVVCHTPLRMTVVPRLTDRRVLVVGEGCGEVARAYGLSRAEGIREYGARHPSLFPRRRDSDSDPVAVDDADDPVAAVMFFEDPEDLGEALQLALDVLLTNGNPSGPRVLLENPEATQKVELWFTNPDLSYSGLAVHPRITQGSYRLCLEALFRSATSKSGQEREVIAQTVGKPSRLTGETARSKLLAQCPEGTIEDDLEIWTVGDNPLSDVALAHTMGWKSALVKTGIWDGSIEPEVEPTIRTDSFAVLLDELMPLTSLPKE